jgi:hypothetical protein
VANYDLGQDLLGQLLRRAGDLLPTIASSDTASIATTDRLIDAKLYLNNAYLEVCALKPWRWNRKRTQFASIAEVTGSVTLIAAATVTLGATIAASMAGRKFVMDADGIPARISAHTAGSATLTLAVDYTGSATSGSFTIFQDEITVATDILAFPTIREMHNGDWVDLISERELEEIYPRNVYGTSRSRRAAFISDSVIRLAPWNTDRRLFECTYSYRPSPLTFDGVAATDTPILPTDARRIIADRALEMVYSDKRDAREAVARRNVQEIFQRLSATEVTFAKPRMWVKRGQSVSGY